jgi:hypothetical protein
LGVDVSWEEEREKGMTQGITRAGAGVVGAVAAAILMDYRY